jgi:hypothetical protein
MMCRHSQERTKRSPSAWITGTLVHAGTVLFDELFQGIFRRKEYPVKLYFLNDWSYQLCCMILRRKGCKCLPLKAALIRLYASLHSSCCRADIFRKRYKLLDGCGQYPFGFTGTARTPVRFIRAIASFIGSAFEQRG